MLTTSRNGGARLAFRPAPPLDFDLTLQRYRLWGIDPANVYADGAFVRVARAGPAGVPFRLTAAGPVARPVVRACFEAPDTPERRAAVRGEVRRLLGLDADLGGFYAR